MTMKHADYNKGDFNLDSLPDTDSESNDDHSRASTPVQSKNTSSVITSLPINESMKRYIYEETVKKYLQTNPEMATSSIMPSNVSSSSATKASVGFSGETPLDLSSAHVKPSTLAHLLAGNGSESGGGGGGGGGYDNDMDGSEGESSHDRSMGSNAHHSQHSKPGKRYRTQMSNSQLKVMKRLFTEYKTPTMGECELVGREIGLQKRVVQVWFQNARAKEKKNKASGIEAEPPTALDRCILCKVPYTPKLTLQDHLFTKSHIELLKLSEDCREGGASSSMMAELASPSPSRERSREVRSTQPVNGSSKKLNDERSKNGNDLMARKSQGSTKTEPSQNQNQQAMQMNPFGDLGALMMGDPNMMAYAAMYAMNPYYNAAAAMPGMLNPYASKF